jgi:hypothetical protein
LFVFNKITCIYTSPFEVNIDPNLKKETNTIEYN